MKVCLSCNREFQEEGWRCPHCNEQPAMSDGFITLAPELLASEDEFEAGAFADLIQLEAGHFWFVARNRLLTWALRHYFPGATRFLEIGCGTGFVLAGMKQEFPEMQLSGCDLYVEGLAYAGERVPEASLFQVDARRMPFREEFDVTGAFDVIEHIQEDEDVLAQMYHTTRPGGGVMLTVPQHPFLWTFVDEFAHHKRRYTRSELRLKAEKAGFEILHMTSFVSLLLPVMALSRFKHYDRDNFDVLEEFKVNPAANTLLKQVMKFEFALLKRGLVFPLGGSLLAVCRKPR